VTALLIFELGSGRRVAAAWDALAADEKARAAEARGLSVGILPVPVSTRSVFATRDQQAKRKRQAVAPRPPAGYSVRSPAPIARSTARRPWTDWQRAWEDIRATGGWTEWGSGHVDAPTIVALEGRGRLLVAEWVGGGRRRRNLFYAVGHASP
jgi:hypothetical protein